MNRHNPRFGRREFLGAAFGATLVAASPALAQRKRTKSVAAIVTIYRENSHADVIVGKILNGWKQDGGVGPDLKLASLYVDQSPDDDMSRKLAQKHGECNSSCRKNSHPVLLHATFSTGTKII